MAAPFDCDDLDDIQTTSVAGWLNDFNDPTTADAIEDLANNMYAGLFQLLLVPDAVDLTYMGELPEVRQSEINSSIAELLRLYYLPFAKKSLHVQDKKLYKEKLAVQADGTVTTLLTRQFFPVKNGFLDTKYLLPYLAVNVPVADRVTFFKIAHLGFECPKKLLEKAAEDQARKLQELDVAAIIASLESVSSGAGKRIGVVWDSKKKRWMQKVSKSGRLSQDVYDKTLALKYAMASAAQVQKILGTANLGPDDQATLQAMNLLGLMDARQHAEQLNQRAVLASLLGASYSDEDPAIATINRLAASNVRVQLGGKSALEESAHAGYMAAVHEHDPAAKVALMNAGLKGPVADAVLETAYSVPSTIPLDERMEVIKDAVEARLGGHTFRQIQKAGVLAD